MIIRYLIWVNNYNLFKSIYRTKAICYGIEINKKKGHNIIKSSRIKITLFSFLTSTKTLWKTTLYNLSSWKLFIKNGTVRNIKYTITFKYYSFYFWFFRVWNVWRGIYIIGLVWKRWFKSSDWLFKIVIKSEYNWTVG